MCVGLSGAEGEGAFGICSARNRPWICLVVSELFPEFCQAPVLKGLISLSSSDPTGAGMPLMSDVLELRLGIQVGKADFCQGQ